jgi:ectoine hydroxylase-related dioxygenase (phytanoyl-CoA dioxygenase family)
LGPGLYNAFYSGNTAMPSENRQPVHADMGQLWPDLEVAHPAYGLVVNVGLVDMSPENGSTELWLGTHKDTSVVLQSGDIEVDPERLEARRAVSPPIQGTVPQGSVVIRDIRLWHAGMPNRTQTPRPMLAMIHYVSWWPAGPIKLHRSAESLLMHTDLRQHADFTDEEIDYVSIPGAHAYTEGVS